MIAPAQLQELTSSRRAYGCRLWNRVRPMVKLKSTWRRRRGPLLICGLPIPPSSNDRVTQVETNRLPCEIDAIARP